ncbi:MAG: hypothetical protein JNK94_03555 [Hyphomonadaceae bacterium]|nr:hypothetical protein [Hyphomonadaceae bacterium]
MQQIIVQVQMLLVALSGLLPLVREEHRGRAGEILAFAGAVLKASGALAANASDLARKLTDVRAEVESMAESGRPVTAEEMEGAIARVRAASAAFRAALEIAEGAAP